jgi:hypothetical protein
VAAPSQAFFLDIHRTAIRDLSLFAISLIIPQFLVVELWLNPAVQFMRQKHPPHDGEDLTKQGDPRPPMPAASHDLAIKTVHYRRGIDQVDNGLREETTGHDPTAAVDRAVVRYPTT